MGKFGLLDNVELSFKIWKEIWKEIWTETESRVFNKGWEAWCATWGSYNILQEQTDVAKTWEGKWYQLEVGESIIFLIRNGFWTSLLYFSCYKQHMGLEWGWSLR